MYAVAVKEKGGASMKKLLIWITCILAACGAGGYIAYQTLLKTDLDLIRILKETAAQPELSARAEIAYHSADTDLAFAGDVFRMNYEGEDLFVLSLEQTDIFFKGNKVCFENGRCFRLTEDNGPLFSMDNIKISPLSLAAAVRMSTEVEMTVEDGAKVYNVHVERQKAEKLLNKLNVVLPEQLGEISEANMIVKAEGKIADAISLVVTAEDTVYSLSLTRTDKAAPPVPAAVKKALHSYAEVPYLFSDEYRTLAIAGLKLMQKDTIAMTIHANANLTLFTLNYDFDYMRAVRDDVRVTAMDVFGGRIYSANGKSCDATGRVFSSHENNGQAQVDMVSALPALILGTDLQCEGAEGTYDYYAAVDDGTLAQMVGAILPEEADSILDVMRGELVLHVKDQEITGAQITGGISVNLIITKLDTEISIGFEMNDKVLEIPDAVIDALK